MMSPNIVSAFVHCASLPFQSSVRPHHRLLLPRYRPRSTRMTLDTDTTRCAIVRTSEPLDEVVLESFGNAVKGEWSGFEGEFDPAGAPLVIPDYYIPEDFATWGLQPKGFECTHSTILRGTKYYLKHLRVLPAVSLFADHVDLETDFRVVDFAETSTAHCFPNGSYSGGPSPVVVDKKSLLEKWPMADLTLRIGKRALHCQLRFNFAERRIVEKIRLVKEDYSCIYCDGADVEGSSGYIEGWPTNEKGNPDELAGKWQNSNGEVVDRKAGPAEVEGKLLYLPEGITVGVNESDDGGVNVWLGWMFEQGKRATMTRCYTSDGSVVQSSVLYETRLS